MKKPIVQVHPSGCGVACVAQVLEISYGRALRLFRNGELYAMLRGFYCRDLVRALNKAGRKSRFVFVNNRQRKIIYRNGTIVFIARSKHHPQGHYLARVENQWMDPWINWPKITCGRAGFRRRLPGRPIYAVIPQEKSPALN